MSNLSEAYSREQTLLVQKIVCEHNGSDFVFVEDVEAKKELWQVECFGPIEDIVLRLILKIGC